MKRSLKVIGLSFPDQSIVSMSLDHAKRTLELKLTGAWNGEMLGPGILSIWDWYQLTQRRFEHESQAWAVVDGGEEEQLKDICEFEVTPDKIVLRGFGIESGCWLEWKILECAAEYVIH